jgi:hypothetical protein
LPIDFFEHVQGYWLMLFSPLDSVDFPVWFYDGFLDGSVFADQKQDAVLFPRKTQQLAAIKAQGANI